MHDHDHCKTHGMRSESTQGFALRCHVQSKVLDAMSVLVLVRLLVYV